MKTKKMAICIPTYNRAAIIEETLVRSVEKYKKKDWDLFIYDSSTDNSTRNIVENYKKEFSGLFYKYIDSSVHSNLKVFKILQDFSYTKKYEYVWICTDTFTWSEELLDAIQDNLNSYYDLLVVNYRDVEKIGTREFVDYNDLFVNCAWHITYYGAVIYRIETMLQEIPWEYLKATYCISERINFSHVAFCFEKICTMNHFRAKHLSFDPGCLRISPMKRNTIGWKDDAFYIFCICWPSVIMALPDCYQDKKLAIRKHGINSGMFLERTLMQFREEGLYTYKVYKKYEKIWQDLTSVSNKKLKMISLIPPKWVGILQFKHFYNWVKVKKRIAKFTRKYSKIYLYGCGAKAANFAQCLEENNIEFEGFIVTSARDEKKTFMNKRVLQFEADILFDSQVGLILALNKNNAEEVMDVINKANKNPVCGILSDI